MSKFTTILFEGNGKRTRTHKPDTAESEGLRPLYEALIGLVPAKPKTHGDIKIEVTIETHEYNYFITSESAEPRDYSTVPALFMHRDPSDAEDEDMQKWKQELQQFEQLKSRLWKDRKLRHSFVAVKDGKVVDHGSDKFALVRRVSQQFPDRVILIVRVQRGIRVVDMPSPELQ